MIDEQGSAEQRPNVHGSSQPHEQTLQTFKKQVCVTAAVSPIG